MDNNNDPLIEGEYYFIIHKGCKDAQFMTVGVYVGGQFGLFMIIGTEEEFSADMYDVVSHIRKPVI